MPLSVISNIAIIIAASIGFVLGWMEFSFTYIAAKELRVCWPSQPEMQSACTAGPPYKDFKIYEAPMANAHFAYFQLICSMILIGYVLKASFAWCSIRTDRRMRDEERRRTAAVMQTV